VSTQYSTTKKSRISENPSGSQEPDHRKKNSGKYPSNQSKRSPLDSSSCAPPSNELSPGDDRPFPDHPRSLSKIIPMEIEDDEEDTSNFDILNARSDIQRTCVLMNEVNNQPGPSRRSDIILDPIKLTFPKLPERYTLEQTSGLSSDEELYVNPGTRFIKKFQQCVSDVKNSHIFNWINKSKKPEGQEPSDSKVKSKEDFARSPKAVSDVVNSCVPSSEFESEDKNSVQFFDQQAKTEFIAIQIEDDNESETDDCGNQNQNGKWAVNLNVGNEVDSPIPGPSRVNKRCRSNTEQQRELPLDDVKKGDVESDDSLETVKKGSFQKVKKNPVLNWIKRNKIARPPTKSETSNQSNGSLNDASSDFSDSPSKGTAVTNSQHTLLNISTSSRMHRLVRRLKRKLKTDIEQDTTPPQPKDKTPEHSVPSPSTVNDEDDLPGPSMLCNSSEPETSPPIDQSDITIEIDSDEDNDENCCMQSIQRCVCGAKEKACVMCSFMERQKRKWDEWNPDLNNPFFMCLAESKLAGLKEVVKPNRGICFR